MKGILIEKNGRKSVVMANSGKFMSVPSRRNWNPGDEVDFQSPTARATKVVSMAATLVLVMALSLFGVYAANSYTVNLDVNPSIKIGVNAFNNVTDITALNDDAEQIGNLQSLVGQKLGPAVNSAILLLLDEGYLEADGTVVLSIDGKNKVKTVVREVSESVADANIESEQTNADENSNVGEDGMNIYVGRITQEIVEAAEQYNIPYGRALLVSKAIEEGSDINYEAATVLSVREIQRISNISKTMGKIADSEDKDESKGNSNSSEKSKQTQALSNKAYKEVAKIEDYLSELAVIIDEDEADEKMLAEYDELSKRLDTMYSRFEESGMGTIEEVMNSVMSMTKNKGEDAQLKSKVKEEVKTSLSDEQPGKSDANKQKNEDNNGNGSDKGKDKDKGQSPVESGNGQDSSGSDQDSSGSDNGNSQGGNGGN